MGEVESFEIPPAHLYLDKHPDVVRWVSTPEAGDLKRLILVGTWDYDAEKAEVQFCEVSMAVTQFPSPVGFGGEQVSLRQLRSWSQPGRVTELQLVPHPEDYCTAVTSTSEGQVCLLVVNADSSSVVAKPHEGWITGMDLRSDGQEVVTVGSDGKICITGLAQTGMTDTQTVVDSQGALSLSSTRWTSASEIVTGGGVGGSLLCWDRRQAGRAVSKSLPRPGVSPDTKVLSIDVHSSRKHLCAVGCTGGEVLVWDMRFQQQPVEVIGRFKGSGRARQASAFLPSDSSILCGDVWDVHFDFLSQQVMTGGGLGRPAGLPHEGNIPPLMACSQDGVLAMAGGGGEPFALLKELYAINCFDVDLQFGQDVICGLDSECLVFFRRPRY